MEDIQKNLHLTAGRVCGKEATCGSKMDYKSEETATKVAEKLSIKYDKDMEAYPCYFCGGWHIGRKMSQKELEFYASIDNRKNL